jgi:hypothetical protein
MRPSRSTLTHAADVARPRLAARRARVHDMSEARRALAAAPGYTDWLQLLAKYRGFPCRLARLGYRGSPP